MGEVDEDLESLANDVVALFALDAGHKAHAAGIVFIARMVEALGLTTPTTKTCRWGPRETVRLIQYLHGYLLMNKVGLLSQLSGTAKTH